MTTFIFLRHGTSIANEKGVLAGRTPNVYLSPQGIKQAKQLTQPISELKVHKVLVSPLERCAQTIEPYLNAAKKRSYVNNSFVEMNYGDWSDKSLKDLRKLKDWKQVQEKPSKFTFPNGESFLKAQSRVVKELDLLAKTYPNKTFLIVSHGDIIKLAVASSLNMKLDDFQRIVIDPASITAINWDKGLKTLLYVNRKVTKRSSSVKKKAVRNLRNRRVLGGGKGE